MCEQYVARLDQVEILLGEGPRALREETAGLARFLFEDFAHYFSLRKPREQRCVLIVDEFSALAAGEGMSGRVEQARTFNAALVLAPQVVAGMGAEGDIARILGSVETVICHRVDTPDEIVALAGTRRVPEYSTRLAPEGPTGEHTVRLEQRHKIDPNDVRGLAPGEAFVISRGRAMRVPPPAPPASAERDGGPRRGVEDLPF